MTIISATLLLLLCIVAAISAIHVIRVPLSWKPKMLLLILRFFLLALVAISFIEPVLVFEQLPARRGSVPVLIDASKSMRMFLGDSIVTRSLAQLEAWNAANAGKKQKFVFYAFGDSLIPLKNSPRTLRWSHKHSFLPESIKDHIVRRSNAMLLISDGNWSNASLPLANFSDKNVFYLPLKCIEKRPYLQMALSGFPAFSTIDSPLVSSVAVEGVSSCNNNEIAITLLENNKKLQEITIPAQQGFYKNNVRIILKNATPGRHLYRFEAHSEHDSLNTCCYVLHSKLPKQFYYTLYNDRPTLDRRFIQLALERQHDFMGSSAGKEHDPDLLILFDWDHKAQRLFNSLKPGGTALCIGALPCTTSSVFGAARSRLLRPPKETVSDDPFEDFDITKLPPFSTIAYCKLLRVPPRNVFLKAVVQAPNLAAPDTLNLFFTGRIGNRNYVACAAKDIWRCDFMPLAIEPDENHAFAFSERLIAFSKAMLVNSLSDELFLYPSAALLESDSLGFHIALPVGLPVPADVRVRCKFASAQRGIFDTAFVIKYNGISQQTVRFKPLPFGAYTIEASAEASDRRYHFEDSVFVDEDRSEYMVNGQNSALLQEIAQPIADLSPASLKTLFFNTSSENNQPVKRTVPLNRSWPLLLLIFGIFATEWVLRRVLKLD